MRGFFQRYEVWIFLCSIVIAQAIYVGALSAELLPGSGYNTVRFALLGLVLFGVVYYSRRWRGVMEVVRPLMNWRVSPLWYLFALCWAPLICATVLFCKAIIAGYGFEVFVLKPEILGEPGVLRTVLFGSLVGEIVWVSFSISRLSPRFGRFGASQVVGMFWALWWTPIALFKVAFIPELPLAPFLFSVFGVAATCAFVYHHSKSGLIVLLLQIVLNSSILIFPVLPIDGGVETFWTFAIVYWTAAVTGFLIFGPHPLVRARMAHAQPNNSHS